MGDRDYFAQAAETRRIQLRRRRQRIAKAVICSLLLALLACGVFSAASALAAPFPLI